MGIITTAEVKSILGITASTYDTQIAYLIPYIQDDVVTYLNNDFRDDGIKVSGATIAFLENGASADSITDSDSAFVTAGFEAEMDITVEGSKHNDGIYNVDTVIAGTLTLDTTDDLTAEAAGEAVEIYRVKWPKGLNIYVAQMIWSNVTRSLNKDVKSESIGDYSVTFSGATSMSLIGGGYPTSIASGLLKWKRANFV